MQYKIEYNVYKNRKGRVVMESIFWLTLLVILLICEIITLGLTTIWFAGGALTAFLISLTGAGFWIQLISFLLISFAMLFFTRPIAARFINKNMTKTNAEGLIGRKAKVLIEIDNNSCVGQALVDGQEWTARSADDEVIPAGTMVEIVQIRGVKLIVRKPEP